MTPNSAETPPGRQPIFNIPPVIVALLAAMLAIHAVVYLILSDNQFVWTIVNFAFWPVEPAEAVSGARIWSFATYALLHGGWSHVLINAFWMAAFGSPLAWRFGTARFLLFSAVAAVAGALVHLLAHGGDEIPLVGASAAVSAHMAGAARFLFITPRGMPRSYWTPAAPLWAMVQDTRTMAFLGVWIVINLAIGLFGTTGFSGNAIAWEAHLGGFAVGLFLFRLFDPVPTVKFLRAPPPPPGD